MKNLFLKQALINVKKSYLPFFESQFELEYFNELNNSLKFLFSTKVVCPKFENIFKAFTFFELDETNLVILGQDPYHLKDMADGLAFSTTLDVLPRSLANIFNELKIDFNINRKNANLNDIAKQNVLLLNTCLTVTQNNPLSHKGLGWEIFTKNFLQHLSSKNKNVIYLLMGQHAQNFIRDIQNSYAILSTSHPSPFSYKKSLFGSRTFWTINEMLIKQNKKPLKW